MSSLLQPDLLRVVTLLFLCLAWFSLVVSLIEERSSKITTDRDPEYVLAISIVKKLCWINFFPLTWMTYTYIYRALDSWAGLTATEITISFLNYMVVFAMSFILGTSLFVTVWWCQSPTRKEVYRRQIIRENKRRYESRLHERH